jgi:hypothetical protein
MSDSELSEMAKDDVFDFALFVKDLDLKSNQRLLLSSSEDLIHTLFKLSKDYNVVRNDTMRRQEIGQDAYKAIGLKLISPTKFAQNKFT